MKKIQQRAGVTQEGAAGGPGALALLAGLIHVKVQHVAHGEPLPFVFSSICLLSILMLIIFCSWG